MLLHSIGQRHSRNHLTLVIGQCTPFINDQDLSVEDTIGASIFECARATILDRRRLQRLSLTDQIQEVLQAAGTLVRQNGSSFSFFGR